MISGYGSLGAQTSPYTIAIAGMMVEEEDFHKNHQPQLSQNVGFSIYGQTRTLIVSASSVEEKQKWIRVSAT